MKPAKRNSIIYWVSTIWLVLGMVSTGIVQVMNVKSETEFILDLGYPAYFLMILGISKLLGVVVVLLPRLPLLKEWAYAGFFFMMAGAIVSHLASHNTVSATLPALLLLSLIMVSWYFRPIGRKLAFAVHTPD